jgi:predicted ATP-grasp superfamily ATP-dependent carboligase
LKNNILITNQNYKNTLAAVRALGVNNVYSVTCGPNPLRRISSFSKYCTSWFQYTDPRDDLKDFVRDILKIIGNLDFEMIMPVGVDTYIPFSYYKKVLMEYTRVPVADYGILVKAHDKFQALNTASKLGIHTPKTLIYEKSFDVLDEFDYPLVIKARKETSGYGTRIAFSRDEAELYIDEFNKIQPGIISDYTRPMIQEFIPGEIRDICTIFNKGEARGGVVQRRILTYPPRGGVGIVNETIEDEELLSSAFKLLREIKWNGVAQVEFKLNEEGIPHLMELNPKFWGTLELSIKAGVNFPYMLYRMEMEGDVEPCQSYRKGVQMWWAFAHYPQIFLATLENPKLTWDLIRERKARKVWDLSPMDLLPNLLQLGEGLVRMLQFRELLKHPSM